MGTHARIVPPHPDRTVPRRDPGAVIGWDHVDFGSGIELKVQSSRSRIALESEQIDTCHLLLTRNQALLLGRYLLDVTGHGDDAAPRRGWTERLFRSRRSTSS